MRLLLPFSLMLLVACQDSGGEKDSSRALQKTKAQLDRAKAELRDIKTRLSDAKAKLAQFKQARAELSGGEDGDAPPLPPVGDAIRCASRETCTIDRPYYDAVMLAPLRLLDQMRVMPWQKDGEMHGIKLFGIDEGTIPAALGLEGGDIITAIGGHALTSLNDVMALGSKLRPSNRYELALDRSGDAFTLAVEIVEAPAPPEQP